MLVHLPVYDREERIHIGLIEGILIHPDRGVVEGFFVRIGGIFWSQTCFIASRDVARLSNILAIRSSDACSMLEDHVRLSDMAREGRTVLHQKIITESGTLLGVCKDVQLDTLHFALEWIFPKRWFGWGKPVHVRSIIRITKDAIIVKDPETPVEAPSLPVLTPATGG